MSNVFLKIFFGWYCKFILFFFFKDLFTCWSQIGQPLRKLRMGGGGGRHWASPTDTSNVTTKQKDNNERWRGRGETQQGG